MLVWWCCLYCTYLLLVVFVWICDFVVSFVCLVIVLDLFVYRCLFVCLVGIYCLLLSFNVCCWVGFKLFMSDDGWRFDLLIVLFLMFS